jgi:hypothetical protein
MHGLSLAGMSASYSYLIMGAIFVMVKQTPLVILARCMIYHLLINAVK